MRYFRSMDKEKLNDLKRDFRYIKRHITKKESNSSIIKTLFIKYSENKNEAKKNYITKKHNSNSHILYNKYIDIFDDL